MGSLATSDLTLPSQHQAIHRRQDSSPASMRFSSSSSSSLCRRPWLRRTARRTLGTVLLLVTVFLWTASSFLASVSRFLYSRKHEMWPLAKQNSDYLCRWYLFETLLCHLYKFVSLCYATDNRFSETMVFYRMETSYNDGNTGSVRAV